VPVAQATNQLLVALDVDSAKEALSLSNQLRGAVGGFKIGSRLFTSEGPSIVEAIVARGDRVFLDLKFHDIPHTVAGAVAAATRLGVWMLNVHASGGSAMMRAAADAAREEAARSSQPAPLVIGVTMLTSLNDLALSEIGVQDSLMSQVQRLAGLAKSSGLDGVVASPLETSAIRAACGTDFAIVTPGIRSGADPKGDQRRTMSAPDAIAAGATYLVVGRPVLAASDPREAAERIAAECRATRAS
jgi:orotidine-5'-phosphate decarboxylase